MTDPRKKFRRMVSLKKKRFQDEEFDLDLAYITEKIIAFGFPSEGTEALFRNPMEDCQRFLEKKHKDRYFVYNLCIEKDRQYKDKKFHKRVAKFQFADHNAPPLEMIPKFCEHAANWLNQHPENIIAVHCKAGKGRTGVMISCLLMYMGAYPNAEEAMFFYGNQRTHNGNGVTIPSQRRFINYYETVLKYELPAKHEAALFKRVYVNNINNFEDFHFGISVESNGTLLTFKKKGNSGVEYTLEDNAVTIDLGSVPVSGNAKVTLYNTKKDKKKEPICWFWFHCAYITKEYKMTKKEIDKASTDKKNLIFLEDFSITAYFEDLTYRQFIHIAEEKNEEKKASEKDNNNNNNNNNNGSASLGSLSNSENASSESSEEDD